MLGIDLGAASAAAAAGPGCATMYLAGPWRELGEYVARQLTSTPGGEGAQRGCPTAPVGGWLGLRGRWMAESGHSMLGLPTGLAGAALCRRQGDTATRLASGEQVAKALLG